MTKAELEKQNKIMRDAIDKIFNWYLIEHEACYSFIVAKDALKELSETDL